MPGLTDASARSAPLPDRSPGREQSASARASRRDELARARGRTELERMLLALRLGRRASWWMRR